MAALAIIFSGLFLAIDLRQRGYDPSSSLEIVFAGGIGGFIGARLYYVAEHWGEPIKWASVFPIRTVTAR